MSESDNFIREVQEEVRKDEMKEFWDKYGKYVMAAATVIVLGTAGKVGYDQYKISQQQQTAQSYFAALEQAEDDPDATQQDLSTLNASSLEGFSFMSRMQQARLQAEAGDTENAAASLAAARDDVESPILASLAEFQRVAQLDSPEDRIAGLTPLIAEDQAWRFFALESMSMAQLELNDIEGSLESLNLIMENNQAPHSLRQRATVLIRIIESGSAASTLGLTGPKAPS